jgi:hypothetical protein
MWLILVGKRGGGQQVGIGPAAVAVYGPATDLIVFLVGAAILALLGLGTKEGVVEHRRSLRPPLDGPGVCERRRPDL